MDPLTEKLFAELKKQHGEHLDLKNHSYYLFFKDGLFTVYFDEDEKTIKVEINMLGDSGRVYFTDKKIEVEFQGGD